MLKIDNREKSPKIRALCIEHCETNDIPYEFCNLVVGDYLWEDKGICIELKRIDDFAASLKNGHLDSQLTALQQYPHKMVLIYGDLYYIGKKPMTAMSRAGFHQKLLSISIRDQIPCYHVESSIDVVSVIFDSYRHVEKGTRVEEVQRHPTLPGGKQDPSLALYYALKGVGLQKAHSLKETYGSFSKFLANYKNTYSKLEHNEITKKEFNLLYPANLVSKTTREYLNLL